MANYFEIFSGGEAGVRERFGKLIKEALESISFADVAQVIRSANMDTHVLLKILCGDNTPISRKLIDILVDPLNINIQTAFGEMKAIDSNPTLQDEIEKDANAAGFMIVKGVTPVKLDRLDRLKLFVLLKAYESL